MATPSNIPDQALNLALGSWFATGTFKAALVSAAWSPDRGSTEYRSSFQAHEVTGTNWPAGGVTCSQAVAADKNNHIITLTFNAFTVANVTLTGARYLVRYKVVGSAATDPIILITDLGAAISKTAESFVFNERTQAYSIGPDR